MSTVLLWGTRPSNCKPPSQHSEPEFQEQKFLVNYVTGSRLNRSSSATSDFSFRTNNRYLLSNNFLLIDILVYIKTYIEQLKQYNKKCHLVKSLAYKIVLLENVVLVFNIYSNLAKNFKCF